MKSTLTRNIIIIVAVLLITYSLAQSINNYNALGIFLSLGGFGALCVFIYLNAQMEMEMESIEQEEEEQ